MSGGPAEILALEMATFTFAADEPLAGEEGVVLAYLIRHMSGLVLFDTGFGFGSQLVNERYQPRARQLDDALAGAGATAAQVDIVVNCHLHIDHAGQNHHFPGTAIHAQPAEWELAKRGGHTILEWIEFAGAAYRLRAGDYDLLPGIRVIATPGHTAGHQSLLVETANGLSILAGQACYSRGEWVGEPDAREGLSRAPDQLAYARSLSRLKDLRPARVHFAHDRELWAADQQT